MDTLQDAWDRNMIFLRLQTELAPTEEVREVAAVSLNMLALIESIVEREDLASAEAIERVRECINKHTEFLAEIDQRQPPIDEGGAPEGVTVQ